MKLDKLTPFNDTFGESIGRGKDNVVVPFNKTENLVVKWNHDLKINLDSKDNFQRILYKKRKYEMLKFFLPDFIPDSYFVLGNKQDGNRLKTKEYTLQKKIPQRTIASLNEEQKKDPRLLKNIYTLILKLQNMYRMIQQINNVVEDIAKIDARLDLGGLSKYVDQHINENIKNFNWNITNYNFINSPNLLVDPETMNIYCIDFDRGIWNDEKEAAYTMLISLAKQDNNVIKIIEKK